MEEEAIIKKIIPEAKAKKNNLWKIENHDYITVESTQKDKWWITWIRVAGVISAILILPTIGKVTIISMVIGIIIITTSFWVAKHYSKGHKYWIDPAIPVKKPHNLNVNDKVIIEIGVRRQET